MDLKIPNLDNIKGKLGLGDKEAPARSRGAHSARASRYEEPDYGYEDFGEYAYDDSADYAQDYAGDAGSAFNTGSFAPQMPKLVTADDVRAHTQYTPAEPEPEPAPAPARANRDFGALRPEEQRSAGLSSLFEPAPSASAQPAQAAPASATGAYAAHATAAIPAVPSAEDARVTQRATRIITVIKPESYAEAERVPKILKSGDVAVLSLRNTPDALGKRILDFSFGVACALDARVECVSGHVFAISRGIGLTDGEKTRLRDQGLM